MLTNTPKADLSDLAFADINEKTQKFINETFMPRFNEYNRAALEHSVYKTLEFKIKSIAMLEEIN